jgi:hypothetical protein
VTLPAAVLHEGLFALSGIGGKRTPVPERQAGSERCQPQVMTNDTHD